MHENKLAGGAIEGDSHGCPTLLARGTVPLQELRPVLKTRVRVRVSSTSDEDGHWQEEDGDLFHLLWKHCRDHPDDKHKDNTTEDHMAEFLDDPEDQLRGIIIHRKAAAFLQMLSSFFFQARRVKRASRKQDPVCPCCVHTCVLCLCAMTWCVSLCLDVSVSLCLCASVSLSLRASLCVSLCVSVSLCLCVSVSLCLGVSMSLCLCVSLCVSVSRCLCAYVSLRLCVSVSLCLCVSVSLCLCVSVSRCLSLCLCVLMSLCLSVYVSLCLCAFVFVRLRVCALM